MRLLLLPLACAVCWAQASMNSLFVVRVATPPALGEYIGANPPGAMPITGFRQRNPNDGQPSSSPTTAWLSYDDNNFYAVFLCKTGATELRSRLSRRDDAFADDLVGVMLDTFHDRQHAYIFAVNPQGIQMDAINTEGQGDDWRFDTLWYSEARATPDGFAAKITIPFKSLRFTKEEMQMWRVGLLRNTPSRNESAFWPYITNRQTGFVQQFGELEGIEDVSPGRNIRLIPYGAFAASRTLDRSVVPPAFARARNPRFGLDAKTVLHESLTLDVTVNPDFSQVESDDPQVTINQRFEVFFPERRPFFLENASYFQTPENLLFSRRIGDPLVGTRLTGRLGQWSIGVLAAGDRAPGRRVAASDPLYQRMSTGTVVRLQRNIFKRSTIGVFASSRDFGNHHNRVGSIDARLLFGKNWTWTGQAMYSDTRLPNGSKVVGPAYFTSINRSGLHWFYFGNFVDRNPGFRADLGFIPRVDVRQSTQNTGYNWRPKATPISRIGLNGGVYGNWNRAGRIQDWSQFTNFNVEFRRASIVGVFANRSYELYNGVGLHLHNRGFFFDTNRFKRIGIAGSFGTGRRANYSPSAGGRSYATTGTGADLRITLRPNSRLRVMNTYIYSRLAQAFTNHIVRSQVNYQFTRSYSLRTIVDYNAVIVNPARVSLTSTRGFTGDLLLAYIPHPGTAVYLGYTNRRENLAFDPTGNLARTSSPSFQTGGQVFVKVSYLVQF